MNKECSYNFLKQPWETFRISFDFSENMESGETINLGSSTVSAINDADSESSTTEVLDVSSLAVLDDTKLTVIVKAGADLSRHIITLRAYISATKKLEDDIGMVVND